MKGDRKGQHSIQINDQWRICFVWRGGRAEHLDAADVQIAEAVVLAALHLAVEAQDDLAPALSAVTRGRVGALPFIRAYTSRNS